MAYRAQLTDLAEARAPLIKLWTENLPVVGDPDAKLDWFYRDAPGGHGEAFLLRDAAGTAVGCAGMSTRELVFGDHVIRAALLADFAVDKQHRSGLPALVLQRAVKRHVESHYAMSYGFPNDHAVAIHRRTGYRELGKMARFVRVLRHGAYLQRRFGWNRRAQLGGAIADRALIATSFTRALPQARHFALRWEPDFDARWDRLWEVTRQRREAIACRRSSAFLRWRFTRKPDDPHAIAALVTRGANERLAAYAVVKQTGSADVARLADVYGESMEALDALLGLLVPALYARGYGSIEFRYLGHGRVREVLARHWFSFRNTDRTVIVSPTASCPIDPAVACDSNAWFMTDLDEDT